MYFEMDDADARIYSNHHVRSMSWVLALLVMGEAVKQNLCQWFAGRTSGFRWNPSLNDLSGS